MKTVKMNLSKDWGHLALLGHCQVTYTSRNAEGQRLVYCLQYQGEVWRPKVKLLRCTQDGEASHEVKFVQVRADFEKPVGDSKTEQAVREWIDEYNSEVAS